MNNSTPYIAESTEFKNILAFTTLKLEKVLPSSIGWRSINCNALATYAYIISTLTSVNLNVEKQIKLVLHKLHLFLFNSHSVL